MSKEDEITYDDWAEITDKFFKATVNLADKSVERKDTKTLIALAKALYYHLPALMSEIAEEIYDCYYKLKYGKKPPTMDVKLKELENDLWDAITKTRILARELKKENKKTDLERLKHLLEFATMHLREAIENEKRNPRETKGNPRPNLL